MMPDLFGRDPVQQATELLKLYVPRDGQPYYLAFSGGKDSVTIYRLAELAGVPFTAHYSVCPDPP